MSTVRFLQVNQTIRLERRTEICRSGKVLFNRYISAMELLARHSKQIGL
jgi:hypothetical protein